VLGLRLAVGFVAALIAAWAFALVAQRVVLAPGGLPSDDWARDLVEALGRPSLTRVMRTVTVLGNGWVLSVLSLLVAAWLRSQGSRRRLFTFLAIMIGGGLLNWALKLAFARARPSWAMVALPGGYSFPSGHAMGSMLFFGSLGYVLYFTVERGRTWRWLAAAACGLAAAMVGASRVYLGVHYLTDVVAGFFAAICWMGVCLAGTTGWARWRGGRRRAAVVALALLTASAAPTAAGPAASRLEPPCLECVVWELDAGQAEALLVAKGDVAGLRLAVRGGAAASADLWRRLAERGIAVGVAVDASGAAELARRELPPAVSLVVIDAFDAVAVPPEAAAFDLKRTVTELRAAAPWVSIGATVGAVRSELAAVSPYLDFVVDPAPAAPGRWARLDADTIAPGAVLAASRVSPPDSVLAPWPGGAERVLALHAQRRLLHAGLTPLVEAPVQCAPPPPSGASCTVEGFLDPDDGSAVALVEKPAGVSRLRVAARRVTAGLVGEATTWSPSRPREDVLEVVPDAGLLVVRLEGWREGDERFAAAVEVAARRSLTVAEVIARHQAAAARQRRLVRSVIASGRTTVTFQAPGLAAPLTLASATTLYAGAQEPTEVEHRDILLNGVTAVVLGADGVPRLPIVEPERVGQPPLAIALDDSYSYRLEGRETVAGHDCYRVSFAPARGRGSLYRGSAWIDSEGFGLVRLAVTQTGLRGAIVSSEQRDDFVPRHVGGQRVWLLERSETHQTYEGPGHRTPIDRRVWYERLEPNPADFAARREQARASDAVMMRETPQGFRYLRRLPASTPEGPRPRVPGRAASRVTTLAAGVLIDPNISQPLPFAGVGYVDFDFLGTGAQVNAFLGAGFAQASWSVPSVAGSRWQLQGSAFATFVEYNDRAFRDGLERYEENLRQRRARVALAAVRPLSARSRVRLGYELTHTRLRRADTTAADFVTPVSPLVHALRLGLEAERNGWAASAWFSPAWRQRWEPWGGPSLREPPAEEASSFRRYGVSLARSFVPSPTVVGRVEAAWMGGQDMDRFSRYTFDSFENRLRGYPTHTVRFDRGGVVRAVATWAPAARLRLDGFADVAFVHDPGLDGRRHAYPGLGAGLEAPLPVIGLVAVEWGYGFEGRDASGRRGTHVVRVTAYRPF
jgi:undecaprenyl-diphosphatase